MGIIIDLIVIGIIALFTFIGYKQGLVKSAIKILSFVIAIVITLVLYKPVSSVIIKNTTIDEKLNSTIVENLKLEEKEENEESNVIKDTLSNKLIAGANNTVEEVSNSFTVKLIEICVMILLYIIVRLILRFITALTDLVTELPILKQINKAGGIVYGFLKGVVIILVIFAVVYLVSPAISANQLEVLDSSIIAKQIYNNNILLTLIF